LLDASVKSLSERASSNLVAFKCDITKQEDINEAVKIVSASSPSGLWALINNAGIALVGPIEWLPMEYYRKVMDVNFFGHVAVTAAFLPQIKKTRGRIVNISSVAGLFSAPEMAPYNASKYALEGYSDTLRREMCQWGVDVVLVEPSFMRTAIITNSTGSIAKAWNALPKLTQDAYGDEYFAATQSSISRLREAALPLQTVVDQLVIITRSKFPAPRYHIGRGATFIMLVAACPTFVSDLFVRVLFGRVRPTPKALVHGRK